MDDYELCKRIYDHRRRTGQQPTLSDFRLTAEKAQPLIDAGVIELRATGEGGQHVVVALTPKGERMALRSRR